MQGRLCEPVGGKIQAFPWEDWQEEFSTAASIGLKLMEWTLDHENLCKNPLMTEHGQNAIQALSSNYNLTIQSLTGDCFMQKPFWKMDGEARNELKHDFLKVTDACCKLGISLIVVPLVDNGSIETIWQEDVLVDFLLEKRKVLADQRVNIVFESDLGPDELAQFISRFPESQFGINYDMGNSAALGFQAKEEMQAYGGRIQNVHVKDRKRGGPTVELQKGDVDFNVVFEELRKAGYHGDFILQTARASEGKHSEVLLKYKEFTLNMLQTHGFDLGLDEFNNPQENSRFES